MSHNAFIDIQRASICSYHYVYFSDGGIWGISDFLNIFIISNVKTGSQSRNFCSFVPVGKIIVIVAIKCLLSYFPKLNLCPFSYICCFTENIIPAVPQDVVSVDNAVLCSFVQHAYRIMHGSNLASGIRIGFNCLICLFYCRFFGSGKRGNLCSFKSCMANSTFLMF